MSSENRARNGMILLSAAAWLALCIAAAAGCAALVITGSPAAGRAPGLAVAAAEAAAITRLALGVRAYGRSLQR